MEKLLADKSKTLSTRSLRIIHSILGRTIRKAQVQDKIRRNIVLLCGVPEGRKGMSKGWIVVTERLLDEGPLQIGSVSLPAGVHIVSDHGTAQPVAWATTEPVPDAGRVWAALSGTHAQSGTSRVAQLRTPGL